MRTEIFNKKYVENANSATHTVDDGFRTSHWRGYPKVSMSEVVEEHYYNVPADGKYKLVNLRLLTLLLIYNHLDSIFQPNGNANDRITKILVIFFKKYLNPQDYL